jgi:hypothetical protein
LQGDAVLAERIDEFPQDFGWRGAYFFGLVEKLVPHVIGQSNRDVRRLGLGSHKLVFFVPMGALWHRCATLVYRQQKNSQLGITVSGKRKTPAGGPGSKAKMNNTINGVIL